jgi:DNA-binding IscR family transcriptional regulator
MVTVEDCILGNSALHDRFFATTEILARLVSSAPRTVSMTQLEEATNRPEKELAKLCAALSRAGLLRPDEQEPGKWGLTCDPSLVTLEDVFRCVTSEQQSRSRSLKSASADRAPNDVDLLVMQAMIAINQSVFKHLRQFSLDRLKISAAGMFPSPRRSFGAPRAEDDFGFTISGREASFSPVQIPA